MAIDRSGRGAIVDDIHDNCSVGSGQGNCHFSAVGNWWSGVTNLLGKVDVEGVGSSYLVDGVGSDADCCTTDWETGWAGEVFEGSCDGGAGAPSRPEHGRDTWGATEQSCNVQSKLREVVSVNVAATPRASSYGSRVGESADSICRVAAGRL